MKIQQALERKFQKHRIIFWYDTKCEMRDEFEAVSLPYVEKIELNNNEFGVKYHILREKPRQKFLLYREGDEPPALENWLLDVQLAHDVFQTDKVGLWLAELELPQQEFWHIVADHQAFFAAEARRSALKSILKSDDTATGIRLKMLAVCAETAADVRPDAILEALLDEFAAGQDEKINLVKRSALDEFFWKQLGQQFNYFSDKPTLRDFVLSLFKTGYALAFGDEAELSQGAQVFLNHWKDSQRHSAAFETLSAESAEALQIEDDLMARAEIPPATLDYFELVDRRILSDLAVQVTRHTISAEDCLQLVRQRRSTHWFEKKYKHAYEAIAHAARFIDLLNRTTFTISEPAAGVRNYAGVWHQLDMHYRKFIFHTRETKITEGLHPLYEHIENLYANKYLLPLNDTWQQTLNHLTEWESFGVEQQPAFFRQYVVPFLDNQKKVAVIISDALRFEIGVEFADRLEQESGYTAKVDPMVTLLPSFTALGMAALLPHSRLTIQGKDVLADGQSTQGTINRGKILAGAVPSGAIAVRAKDLMNMKRDDTREIFRKNSVVYVYHNEIDIVGDKRDTEEQVFAAAEKAQKNLLALVKKLIGANFSNLLLTADHGFIYQDRPIDDSDFSDIEYTGDEILQSNRRFVLGRGLRPQPGMMHFTASQIGLDGDVELLLPKSINRLRVKGAGSRYVHGGAALQEIIVPVVQINKKRADDVGYVDVEILRGASTVISTGQLTVTLYQSKPVSAKTQARTLRLGIYTQNGTLISDRHEVIFDFSSENPREREVQVKFVLSRESDTANGQEVLLKLEERIKETTKYQLYKSARYTLRRKFNTDFDL